LPLQKSQTLQISRDVCFLNPDSVKIAFFVHICSIKNYTWKTIQAKLN
jgi:hypothetical protein